MSFLNLLIILGGFYGQGLKDIFLCNSNSGRCLFKSSVRFNTISLKGNIFHEKTI